MAGSQPDDPGTEGEQVDDLAGNVALGPPVAALSTKPVFGEVRTMPSRTLVYLGPKDLWKDVCNFTFTIAGKYICILSGVIIFLRQFIQRGR